jgi:enamine deaminase RidA (YjgF/YER057c/UK114 family)
METVDQRLSALGLSLPTPAAPIANYLPFSRTGNLVIVSGQVPMRDGAIAYTGKLCGSVSLEAGQAAARLCFLNVLAQLRAACDGELDRVAQVLRLGGFIACTPEFTDQAAVMNGASDLAVAIFGDVGRHARSTVGVSALPGNASVEVEGMFALR